MRSLLIWTFLVCSVCPSLLHGQNWTHVGPKSTSPDAQGNPDPNNGFETSQVNTVVVDPANTSHLFVAGRFAGLWESINGGASWTPVNSNITGCGGVSDVVFLNSSSIIISSWTENKSTPSRLAKYDFVAQTWQLLTAFPYTPGEKIVTNQLRISPANSAVYFAATSVGLFRSDNSGLTWTRVVSGFVESMIIVETGGGSYKYYISGSTAESSFLPTGTALLMESTNGIGYAPMNLPFAINPAYDRSHGLMCYGTSTGGTNHDFYVVLYAATGSWGSGTAYAFKITVTNIKTITDLTSSGMGTCCNDPYNPNRSALVYDDVNAVLYFGSKELVIIKTTGTPGYTIQNGGLNTELGNFHMDIHDLEIFTLGGGQKYLFMTGDGGVARKPVIAGQQLVINYEPLNYGLDVCLINGFSGASANPDLYVIGGQDIVNTDIYDAGLGRNIATHFTWENDGGFINKFDNQQIFIDKDAYNQFYRTSADGGLSFSANKSFYDPNASAPFASSGSLNANHAAIQGFSTRLFYQDPYRPNRVFFGKHLDGIYQYDFVSGFFVRKVNLADLTPVWTEWSGGWAAIRGMSFSPETPNSMHFIVNGTDPGNTQNQPTLPTVIKYIGNNLDDCWPGHYMNTDAGGNPQWANLMINFWQNLATLTGCSGCVSLSTADMYKVNFLEIETSPWDKNVIYVLVEVPNNPHIKVLKYNGTSWSNASTGIPVTDRPYSMIMDIGSNDAIYLSTDKGIYYKHGTSSTWTPYMDGELPIMQARQVEINYTENTVRAGLYGRGIWKSPLVCPGSNNPVNNAAPIPAAIYESDDIVASKNTLQNGAPTAFRATRFVQLNPGFVASGVATDNRYVLAYIHGCNTSGTSVGWRGQDAQEVFAAPGAGENEMPFDVYPNPGHGEFTIRFSDVPQAQLDVYSVYGELVHTEKTSPGNNNHVLQLSALAKGVYILKVTTDGRQVHSKKIIIN